jgi:predicted N-acetyltransferase YhbS
MEYRAYSPTDESAVVALFTTVFSESEGEKEGARIGALARNLVTDTASRDLYGFVAADGDEIVGAILFSRLTFPKAIDAFILAPVAVHTAQQRQGVGQALVAHGLRELKKAAVDMVLTYGDPAFYNKTGFRPISQDAIVPPFDLSQPEGWLGQSLDGGPIEPILGGSSCVKALDDPTYW